MINTFFFGINVFLIYFAWSYCLKPSILDHYRSKLVEFQVDVKNYYIKNNTSLHDGTYQALLDLIDGYLSLMEKMSLVKMITISTQVKKNRELCVYLHNSVNTRFQTSNSGLKKFIDSIRMKSSNTLTEYLILSSPLMIFLLFIIAITRIPYLLIKSSTNRFNFYRKEVWSSLNKMFKNIVATQDKLEDFSLKSFRSTSL